MARVLLVDDEETLLQLYRFVLTNNGYEIVGEARNGKEAITIYDSLTPPPDVVLMDHRMPIMDGVEATRDLLSRHPQATVVFASAEPSIKTEVLEMGVKLFETKPFTMNELLEALHGILN